MRVAFASLPYTLAPFGNLAEEDWPLGSRGGLFYWVALIQA
jgi:hypothetical protein